MFYPKIKRIFDFSLATIGLLIFSPVIILVILAILMEDGWPIFYIKKSLGENGVIFNEIKFRSMERNSLYITKSGKTLRETAMDELLQLVNILKGEMSFVGPRSYGIQHYDLAKDRVFFQRLQVTPGLTGLAQVFAPKHASDEEVLKWDLKYINQRSFLGDLRIIFLSVWITLTAGWEKTVRKL